MAGTAPQLHEMTTDESRNISVDLTSLLAAGETLTGAPTVQAPAGMAVDNQQVNAAVIDINNTNVAIGKAVLFRVSDASKGTYTLDVLCSTSDGQLVEGSIKLTVVRSPR